MNKNKVLIIIPNWNGAKFLGECLDSLNEINCNNFEIVVVDNGSSDRSIALIKEKYPEVILIELKRNTGFACACNQGLKYSIKNNFQYSLFLNNDTVVDKNFLNEMLKPFDDEKVGVVGSKIYYFDKPNIIWFAGGDYIGWRASGKHRYWQKEDNDGLRGVKDSDFVTGCVMTIKNEVIKDVGYFFEPYFLTVEDLDFSYYVKKNGWSIKVALDAKVWHKVSFSREGEFSFSNGYYGTRNRLYFSFVRTKNYLGGLILLVVIIPIKSVVWLISGKLDMMKGMLLGVRDFYNKNLGFYRK